MAKTLIKCDNCTTHQVMHTIFNLEHEKRYCCGCYVKLGYPPADWHTVCMETNNGVATKLNEYSKGKYG